MLQYTDKQNSGNMRRALHYVLKIGNREASYEFFTKTLGMNVLRHEEFEEGCKATCNGPYDGKWSKTMVGYGPEDNHFVLELTYNYGIGSYKVGSDLKSITITSNAIHNELKANTFLNESGQVELNDPDGRKYIIRQGDAGTALGDITEVAINANDLKLTADFWESICGMHEVSAEHEKYILTAKDSSQWRLKICQSNATTFNRGTAFGRHAFSCEAHELSVIEKLALHKDCSGTVLTPLVSLDTPGKATVQVVILADPDGHEICFVGDEAFRELSQVDPNADDLLLKLFKNVVTHGNNAAAPVEIVGKHFILSHALYLLISECYHY